MERKMMLQTSVSRCLKMAKSPHLMLLYLGIGKSNDSGSHCNATGDYLSECISKTEAVRPCENSKGLDND